jgi:aspartate/methionine/tyrosine aminotransferase
VLFCLASEADANIVLPSPSFPAFAALAGAWQLRVNAYALPRSDGYRQDASLVNDAIDDRTALALVNTPHNPTGAMFPRPELAPLAAELGERGIPLVVDEVYHPLYFGEAPRSAAGIENVIVIGDMSKALSLPGLRVGWIIDADPQRRQRMIDARSYLTVSGCPIGEAIAAHAIRNREAVLERLMAVASANLRMLTSAMEAVKDVVSWVHPAGATTAFPWFNDCRDSRPFCEALAGAGVLLVPGDCFGAPEHMRIGFGAQAQGFEEAAAILENAILRVAEHAS